MLASERSVQGGLNIIFDQDIKLLLLQMISVELLEHALLDFKVTEQDAVNVPVTQVNNFIHFVHRLQIATFVYGWFRSKLIFKTRLRSFLYLILTKKIYLEHKFLNSLHSAVFSQNQEKKTMANALSALNPRAEVPFLLRAQCI